MIVRPVFSSNRQSLLNVKVDDLDIRSIALCNEGRHFSSITQRNYDSGDREVVLGRHVQRE